VLVQTAFPKHPLFAALIAHDYAAFAATALAEREAAAMPPFSYLALVRAEAKTQEAAQAFLEHAALLAAPLAEQHGVLVYSAVPASVQRVADTERAQLLVECSRRRALQSFLRAWMAELRAVKTRVRWAVDTDPSEI
jgi:primosomal protein N' (replication factor Y) (superfamily II helicase)